MTLAEAQRDMRRTYRGGLHGQLVSAALWGASAAIGTWGNVRLAVILLVIGGFFIFPLTLLALRLSGRRTGTTAGNPLNALAMQVAFTVPLALPIVLTLARFSAGRFYPAMMMIVGAHYLPFMTLYGMWQWLILAAVLLGGGYVLGWLVPMEFTTGAWVTCAALAIFAIAGWRIVVAEERRGRRVIRFMLFIDGTWLYSNTPRLVDASGEAGFALDFGKLPRVLADEVARGLGHDEWTVVRTHLFGSYADNVDPRDTDPVARRLGFFTMLRTQHHYEVEAFPINFRGKRLRKTDRDLNDSFEPKEKCVDIALATSMLFNAAMPNAYDVAIAVLGDQDFKPVLKSVRRLGKRVAIASIQGACSNELSDPADKERLRDGDLIWLEDLLPRLARRYEPHVLECQSPTHAGDRNVTTTYYPRRNEKFYCEACRESFARSRQQENGERTERSEARPANWAPPGTALRGQVSHKRMDKGYGFIRVDGCGEWDGPEYFFHPSDLEDGVAFADLAEGEVVTFEVKAEPPEGKAPPARLVKRLKPE